MLDLSWGNPAFLHPYWGTSTKLEDLPLSYQYTGLDKLKQAIRNIHLQEKNAIVKDKHIVIGNGGSQLLTSAIHVIGREVYAKAPYFPRFPVLAQYAGVKWNKSPYGIAQTEIVTLPNNPDNSIGKRFGNTKVLIHDLSYNWKQYTSPINYNEDIMIFSLAKATGHASTRIGWALFQNEATAKKVEDYIENSTMGVSVEAQASATEILESQLKNKYNVFDFGKEVLDNRWKKLKTLNLPFKIHNSNGMFLWCEGEMPNGLHGIAGNSFGSSNNFFRISIGCSDLEFNNLCRMFE